MYLLQTLSVDQETNKVIIEFGIYAGALERLHKAIVKDEFWGETEITLGYNSDFGFNSQKKSEFTLLPYVNSFEIEDLEDGFKKFHFFVGKRNNKKFEGYMIFIKSSPTDIETNGKKLFCRTPREIVVILKEGHYIKFKGLHFENHHDDFIQVLCKHS